MPRPRQLNHDMRRQRHILPAHAVHKPAERISRRAQRAIQRRRAQRRDHPVPDGQPAAGHQVAADLHDLARHVGDRHDLVLYFEGVLGARDDDVAVVEREAPHFDEDFVWREGGDGFTEGVEAGEVRAGGYCGWGLAV